jgi:hypothetical protein
MGAISGAGSAYPSGAPEFIPVFSGVRVTRSLVLYECFVDRYLSFSTFSFGHCVVCSSSIYGFWLPLWYLQTHLRVIMFVSTFNNISAISWRLVVLVEETGIPGKNHLPSASHWHIMLHEYTSPWTGFELTTFVVTYCVVVNPTAIRSRPQQPIITWHGENNNYFVLIHLYILNDATIRSYHYR